MKRIENRWECPLSPLIPYMSWSGLAANERTRWATPRHSNTCYELHILLSGSCTLDFDAETYVMAPGNAVIISPGVFHAPHTTSDQFCRFSISFSVESQLETALEDISRNGFLFFEPGERILALCNDITRVMDEDRFMSKELSSALFSTVMLMCLQTLYTKTSISTKVEKSLKQEDEIERIDRFFAKSIHDHPTRKKLAQHLHCSERQLNRKIKNLFGMTYQEKLSSSRMDLACYLLRSTAHSISDISSMVGYADTASFYHSFRQRTGITPMEYRKKHQK